MEAMRALWQELKHRLPGMGLWLSLPDLEPRDSSNDLRQSPVS